MSGRLTTYRRNQRRPPTWVDRALSIAVVDNDTADTVRTKRLLTGALWAALATSTLSAIQFFATGANPSGYLLATVPPVLLATLFALWRWPSVYPNVMHPLAAQAILISAVQVVMAGALFQRGSPLG